MAGWVFCDCCEPDNCDANFKDGGGGVCNPGRFQYQGVNASYHPPADPPTHPCEPFTCTIGLFSICFPNSDIADAFVGSGNYDPVTFATDDWVIFFTPDGVTAGAGTFARDAGRPVSLEIDVEAMTYDNVTLGFSTKMWLVPVEVRLAGSWTWTRRSNDPNDGADFHQWDLTDGTAPESAAGECLGLKLRYSNAGLVWDDTFPPNLIAEFEAASGEGPCCPGLNVAPCLVPAGGAFDADDWHIGGSWAKTDVPCCVNGSTEGVHTVGVNFHGGELGGLETNCNVVTVSSTISCPPAVPGGPECGSTKTWRLQCADRGDVKTLPDANDFTIDEDDSTTNCDDHDFTNLTAGTCDDSDPGPPEDCDGCYCEYKWCGDAWALITGVGCTVACPAYEEAGPGPGESIWHYECCDCGGGGGGCPGACPDGLAACADVDCIWTWVAFVHDWIGSVCNPEPDETPCTCSCKPTRDGAFNGETVGGRCCK